MSAFKKQHYEYEFVFLSNGSKRDDVLYFPFTRIKDAIRVYRETGGGCVLIYLHDLKEDRIEEFEIDQDLPHKFAEKIQRIFIQETKHSHT